MYFVRFLLIKEQKIVIFSDGLFNVSQWPRDLRTYKVNVGEVNGRVWVSKFHKIFQRLRKEQFSAQGIMILINLKKKTRSI